MMLVTPVKLPVQNWFERSVMPVAWTRSSPRSFATHRMLGVSTCCPVGDTFVPVVCSKPIYFSDILGLVEQKSETSDFSSGARLTNLTGSRFLLPSSWLRSGIAT